MQEGGASHTDLLAFAPILAALVLAVGSETLRLLGIVWVLKLIRYTPALALLARVIRNERQPLIGVFVAFLIVLLLAATGACVVEREVQPAAFGSIPAAMWWAIVTLTTTGYGDEVPITLTGRLLGAVTMMAGIGMVALFTGILANGFAQETRRRDFLRTCELVARLPLFQSLGAFPIAEITKLLRPERLAPGRTVMRKGQPGDCMYFIASGRSGDPHPARTHPLR